MQGSSTRLLAKLALIALAITLLPQGVWSALIVANLRMDPAVPWSVLVMALLMVVLMRYLHGGWGSSDTAAARRQSLHANLVSRETFAWAAMAGALSVTALVGVWIVLACVIRMPGSVLPDLSKYPWWTGVLAVAMGTAVSPLCEQAGIWGVGLGGLERHVSGTTAVIVTALVFALLPHPPAGMALVAKVLFFFLVGLVFATIAHLTNSILPGLLVHAVALIVFFILIWPHDLDRQLVTVVGTDLWFWTHVAQVVIFAGLGLWAFIRLARISAAARAEKNAASLAM